MLVRDKDKVKDHKWSVTLFQVQDGWLSTVNLLGSDTPPCTYIGNTYAEASSKAEKHIDSWFMEEHEVSGNA